MKSIPFFILIVILLTANLQAQLKIDYDLITGIFGGALFVAAMGIASDLMGGQIGAIVILILCVSYLVFLTTKMKIKETVV